VDRSVDRASELRPRRGGDKIAGRTRVGAPSLGGFTEVDDALLQPLDVMRVQGERPADEPQPIFLKNGGRRRLCPFSG